MTLFNANWISFDGKPITGMVPTTTLVHSGSGAVKLTEQQQGSVAHAYKLFCDAVTGSVFPGGYHVQNRTLEDGTRVRMVSINSVHQVHVWPAGGGGEKLPHGFAVVTNWTASRIFGFVPGRAVWVAYPDFVPQVSPPVTGHNQVVATRGEAGAIVVYPMVHVGAHGQWDFTRHAAPGGASVPVACVIPPGSFRLHPVHFAAGRGIRTALGTTIYEMSTIPPFTIYGSDTPRPMAPHTDGAGNNVALQICLEDYITDTVKWFKFKNHALRRTGTDTYSLIAENMPVVSCPVRMFGVGEPLVTSTLGENAADVVSWTQFYNTVHFDSFGTWVATAGGPSTDNYKHWEIPSITQTSIRFNFNEHVFDLSPLGVASESAYSYTLNQTAPERLTAASVVALGGETTIEYATLRFDVAYPHSEFQRCGGASYAFNLTLVGGVYGPAGYGVTANNIDRRDFNYSVEVDPRFEIDLVWTDFVAFGGSVSGIVLGHKYTDTTYRQVKRADGAYDIADRPITSAAPPVGLPGVPGIYSLPVGYTYVSPSDYYYSAVSGDLRPYVESLIADHINGWRPTAVDYLAQTNSVDYTLTSRHIIDYDHRGRFIAAIKVVVDCAGARWAQAPGLFIGAMEKLSDPTYTVSIYFESTWDDVTDSQLLLSGSCVREGFEFQNLRKTNPYYWPAAGDTRDILVRMPPAVQPGEESIRQLYAVAEHQGVNPHLAVEDYMPSRAASRSRKGIEHSRTVGATVFPTTKFVTGQLYARTFKLSTLNDALWLLSATACDAPYNNVYPDDPPAVMWYYMPALGAAIHSQEFHIEVRNGVIERWSDELPPLAETPVPAETARDIKLYRV